MTIYTKQIPKFCTYLTTYSGNKLPMFYIGSSSIDKIINKNYHGSVKSKKYKEIWRQELKENPHLFKTEIIKTFYSRKNTTYHERKLQIKLNVVKSNMYINMSIAKHNGFFGLDVSGNLNPNFGNTWNRNQKDAASLRTKNLHKEGILKPRPPMCGKNNPRYKDGKTTYKDKNGNYVFTSKTDPRVLSKELIGVGTNVDTANKTKSLNPNIKKYEYIIIQTPNKEIIKLLWNEYATYFKDHILHNFIAVKNCKGYALIEAKLNLNCKIRQPKRKPKSLLSH